VSEADEVLMDDRKRADYNLRWRSGTSTGYGGGNGYYNNNSQYGYGYGRSGSSYETRYKSSTFNGGGLASKFELAIRILTARSSLLNLGFAA
ncbi:MAG: hypothetical protein Q8877_03410, partial [Sweet potato little leaf phytoplasma]|nr:hypothetical protein [Sweet potato little leaf phytoplasma]